MPQPQRQPSAKSTGVNLTRDADLLISTFLPPDEVPAFPSVPALPLPYCAPQITSGYEAPFSRGYHSALETVDISQEQLLSFIDGLNLAMTASPPLRVVNLAGMVIGFVPYHWAQVASIGMQAGAQVGMRVLSKTLTDRYIRAANKRLFHPRGLSVRICTTAAMQRLVLPPEAIVGSGELSKMDKVGRKAGAVMMKVPIPLTGMIVHAIAKKPPTVAAMDPQTRPQNKKLLATQRRVAALAGYILQLDFERMPKPAKAEGVMDTMASWGVKFDGWRKGRSQSKAEDKRLQLEEMRMQQELQQQQSRGSGSASSSRSGLLGGGQRRGLLGGGLIGGVLNMAVNHVQGSSSGSTSSAHDARSTNSNRLTGLLAQRGVGVRGGNSFVIDREQRRLQQDVANADLEEYWEASKLLWVVIVPKEMDEQIEGIELAEREGDVEEVSEDVWREEMVLERREAELDGEIEREQAKV
uniref:Uncharacterized protein n=1 Tax=Mycena chlorophos TaxID=658473 RepID=A0ABQ0LKM1_MYCCL|nr:predicted protein [Mycena chlorophos]